MKNRLPLIVVSLLIVMSMLLSACSTATSTASADTSAAKPTDAQSPATNEPVATGEKTTIKVMSFFAYDTPQVEEAVVAAFEAKYPEIDVDFESVAFSDIFLKYKTLIAGNTPPDVMSMNFDNAYSFAAMGALEPLDSWIKSTGLDTSIYFDSTLNLFKLDGVQYSMPATYSDVVLFFNKDMFDAAGVEYPQKDWTAADLKAAALALTKDTNGDGQLDQFGYVYPWYPIVLEQYNAKIWDAETNKCTLNSEAGIKAIQAIADSRYGAEQFAPNPDQLAQQGDWDMFMAGKLAMLPTGPWAVGTFNEKITTFTYDIAHMPAGDKQATHVYGNSYAMAAGSKNKAAAWKFIEFATGPEGTKIRQDGKYEISPVKSVAEGYVASLAGGNPEHANIFMEVMDYAVVQPAHAHWTEISAAIQPELDLALSNQKSVKDALDAACAAVDPILAQP